MANLIQVPLDDEDFIFIEVEDTDNSGKSFVNRGDKAIEKVTSTFEKSIAPIQKISQSVITKLKNVSTEVAVELSLKFNMEGNLIITKASGEASIKITIKWNKSQSETQADRHTPNV